MIEITEEKKGKKKPFFVEIPGPPVGKGRPRLTRHGRAYTPKLTKDWESKAVTILRAHWRRQPLEGPCRLVVEAVKARPKAMQSRRYPDAECWRTKKPDADNVGKAAADAIEKAGLILNDSQIVEMVCRSLYAAKNQPPCVRIYFAQSCEQIDPVGGFFSGSCVPL